MSKILIAIYTIDDISTRDIAMKFFKTLENHGLIPNKVGLFEPLKLDYTIEKAISLWSLEEDGCYEEGIGMIGKAGGLLANSKNPKFNIQVSWWKCPNKTNVNNINFSFPVNIFNKHRLIIEKLFIDILILVNAVYGYISHYIPLARQHVPGTIQTRLPGVFWCNYFGKPFVEFFNKEKILSYAWFQTNILPNGGILAYLTSDPHKELLKTDTFETKAKLHLGIESFGDIEEYNNNPEIIQKKNVPIL